MTSLTQLLQGTPFLAYTYAYPHKHAYRPFPQAIPLTEVWQKEDQSALFLYIHIPFCEIRCGFCNLFTTNQPQTSLPQTYVHTLWRQAQQVRAALPQARIAQLALGGGTPTFLTPEALKTVLDIPQKLFEVNLNQIPISVETSPATAQHDKLIYLRQRGVNRLSIGVQSFIEAELKGLGRPQRQTDVTAALRTIRQVGFPTLNIDLIYGSPQQTIKSWLYSLEQALIYQPEELYLYPLYVRPLTGMDKMSQSWDEQRHQLYYEGRDYLLAHGYQQRSLRLFRRHDHQPQQSTTYRCQEDGLIGLGCGARSYTQHYHYSSEYAVSRPSVKAILTEWIQQPDTFFARAYYGFQLNATEQRHRFILKSLLHHEGINKTRYQTHFGSTLSQDFPQLTELETLGLAHTIHNHVRLTPAGLAWSDVIGPWLYSPAVQKLSQNFELR